jgi:hypothetical protein
MKTGVEIIAEERQRHSKVEGWTPENDDAYVFNQLANAAIAYATPPEQRGGGGVIVPECWPWDFNWWKPTPENRVKELAKAGALIAAEIDRLQRKEKGENNEIIPPMSDKPKTAVQWLFDKYIGRSGMIYTEDIEKALAMEREQIENAHGEQYNDKTEKVITGNQYYTETYGG